MCCAPARCTHWRDVMVHRVVVAALLVFALAVGLPAPASAQQTISVQIGAFLPKGENAPCRGRRAGHQPGVPALRFRGLQRLPGERRLVVRAGQYLEGSAGFGYYQSTVPTVYREWINEDGSEIEQDLKLRIMPATARGQSSAARRQAGLPALRRRRSGRLLLALQRNRGNSWARTTASSATRSCESGTSVGPVAVFGVRGVMSQSAVIGVEGRYQWGRATSLRTSWATRSISAGSASSRRSGSGSRRSQTEPSDCTGRLRDRGPLFTLEMRHRLR